MRQTRPSRHPRNAILGLMLMLLILAGCGTAPEQPGEPSAPPLAAEQPGQTEDIKLALPPSQYSAQFEEVERLLAAFNWMAASERLAAIPPKAAEVGEAVYPYQPVEPEPGDGLLALPPGRLTVDDSIYIAYLQARIAYIRGQNESALAQLSRLDDPAMHPALRYRILALKRQLVELSGDYLQSAYLGHQLLQMASQHEMAARKRTIWRDLQRLPIDQLQSAFLQAPPGQWQAWLELARISRASLAETVHELPQWLSDNAQHPAAKPLPGGLDHLLEEAPELERVALILPLSGRLAPAGKAIRDGYLASYYAARASGAADHEILVLDLDSYDSPGSAYDDAVLLGAGMVVGPLGKHSVAELNNHPGRPVPVLALNRSDSAESPGSEGSILVQFALAPEDEAINIANLAFGRGARSALLIAPGGDWGNKVATALVERWIKLGGRIANSVSYASRNEYSPTVQAGLDIPASEQRNRDLRAMLATKVEFTARRRQDIDVVFLLSRSAAAARSLKPLLAFHYAQDLPIYAISSIYSGISDAGDRDLDGINLVETPWLLGSSPALKVAIAAGDSGGNNYSRLNALGADAFLLQSRFRQLQAGEDALLRGNTGLLSMDAQRQIQRELTLATFDGGAIKPQ